MNFIHNLIKKWALKKEAKMRAKGKVLYITDRNNPNTVYLIRYPVFNNSLFGLYIHRFLRSDQDDPHDHPFHFLSYVVSGEYYEQRFGKINIGPVKGLKMADMFEIDSDWREEGTLAYRRAQDSHIVKLKKELESADMYSEGVMTIVLRSPRFRKWGFWVKQNIIPGTIRQWIYHKDYLPESRFGYKTPETLGK